MNYNKDLINLISQLSNIQQQLVMEKNGEVFNMRANDDKLNVCFTLTAPLAYFDFPGEKIGFFNFSTFKKYFDIFDKPSKDPAISNTPKLDIELNESGEPYILNISSSIDARHFVNKLGMPEVLSKPQFNQINMPTPDAELYFSESDVNDLNSMVSLIKADTIQFHFEGKTCTANLTSMFSGDTYSAQYDLKSDVEIPFDFVVPIRGINTLPSAAYNIQVAKRGLMKFEQLREDDIKLNIYWSRKKA